ncbi:unnamed protein product [Durusdinium trenchii]|uniref:Uncharacterized protein n=2 Tax=Durusdinium trenchii TaxID=1381693 RepID=A0ABP0KKV5_9DINO
MSLELSRHGEANRSDNELGKKDDTPSKSPGKSRGCCVSLPFLVLAEVHHHRKLLPLALAQLLLLADQPLLPANMSQVAKEFHFDGPQRDEMLGGIVAIVFFSTGALFSLVAGRLADLMKRTTLVSFCMLIGGAGTFANSRVQHFGALLLCRGAVGAALGGLLPASFAIVGDMYPAEERPHAIAMMAVISGLGPALGQGLAGFLGSAAGWRAPFALVGAAGLCMALLLFALQKEPRGAEQELEEQKNYCGALCSALKKKTVILTCLQGVFGCVPWAVISTFLTDYLATNAHLGVPGATAVLFSFGIGCFAGTACGGKLGQHLYKRDKRLQAWLMAITVWGGMVPFFILFSAAGAWGHPWLFHFLALLGGLLAPVAGGNAKAILLNTVQTKSRGTVFGVYNIMDDLGKGLGPALVSSWVRPLGRRSSFMLGILFWLPCGLFCWMMTRTVLRDDLSEIQAEEAVAREALTVKDPETNEKGDWTSCEATVSPPTSLYSSSMADSPSSKPQARAAAVLGRPMEEVSSCDEC